MSIECARLPAGVKLVDDETAAQLAERQRQALLQMGSKALTPYEHRPEVRTNLRYPARLKLVRKGKAR